MFSCLSPVVLVWRRPIVVRTSCVNEWKRLNAKERNRGRHQDLARPRCSGMLIMSPRALCCRLGVLSGPRPHLAAPPPHVWVHPGAGLQPQAHMEMCRSGQWVEERRRKSGGQ